MEERKIIKKQKHDWCPCNNLSTQLSLKLVFDHGDDIHIHTRVVANGQTKHGVASKLECERHVSVASWHTQSVHDMSRAPKYTLLTFFRHY